MCRAPGTGDAFIYEASVAVKSQIATQICRADNNRCRARKNVAILAEPGQVKEEGERQREVATRVWSGALDSRRDSAVVISDLSVRARESLCNPADVPSGTASLSLSFSHR